jgi:acyl-CoA synthetase (AMP-forming)/AMP-acid ligase II
MAIEIAGLADIVRIHAARQPDTAAIVFEGRTTIYRALDRAASQVANALIAEGLRPQSRVAHLDKSSDLFFELMFGVAKANAAMGSVTWRLAPPEALPRNPTGKILKRELRKSHWANKEGQVN